MSAFKLFLSSLVISISTLFGGHPAQVQEVPVAPAMVPVEVEATTTVIVSSNASTPIEQPQPSISQPSSPKVSSSKTSDSWNGIHVYTDDELLKMASNKYADGEVPLGDGKYTTSAPKVGYVYLCNVHKDNFGSDQNGPWIHGSTWNFLSKYTVSGSISWPNAIFSNIVSGAYRILSGNDLPINHTTGKFPVSSSDKVYQYDKNPNTISSQSIKESIPANPTYSATPYCMGGEAGIMLSGVALFNALDAPLRDAPAHEAQDSCAGHPQESGEYHYHSLSPCFKDIGVKTVLGYAYDGFPITGPEVAKDKYLTTNDLDECHGIVSEIVQDGKKKVTYHYVMTQDYPYSVSCFRGKSTFKSVPVQQNHNQNQSINQPQSNQSNQNSQPPQMQQGGNSQGGTPPTPPQEAQDACDNLDEGASCTVGGQMTGTCRTVGEYFACIPNR